MFQTGEGESAVRIPQRIPFRLQVAEESRVFLAAILYLTRIPCPPLRHHEQYLARAARYAPLVGWVVGGIAAFSFHLCAYVLPVSVAVLLSISTALLITGAVHEDGLVDFCDGFGGGRTKEDILRIMKDPCTGTFGVVGIAMILAIRYVALSELDPSLIPPALIAGHAVSRLASVSFLNSHRYVRGSGYARARPMAKRMTRSGFTIAGVTGVLPFALFPGLLYFWVLIPVFTVKYMIGRYILKRIGGYTGDCLGATQQMTEALVYIALLI